MFAVLYLSVEFEYNVEVWRRWRGYRCIKHVWVGAQRFDSVVAWNACGRTPVLYNNNLKWRRSITWLWMTSVELRVERIQLISRVEQLLRLLNSSVWEDLTLIYFERIDWFKTRSNVMKLIRLGKCTNNCENRPQMEERRKKDSSVKEVRINECRNEAHG